MIALRILGIGSPFGDDQLGWEVIKLLQQKTSLHPLIPNQLQLNYYDRPGLYLLELMQDAHCVFLIDAIKTGAKIGTIHCFENQAIEQIKTTLSSHSLGVASAMLMGRALQTLPNHVILYGIEIDEVLSEFNLSTPIINAIQALSTRIEQDILRLF